MDGSCCSCLYMSPQTLVRCHRRDVASLRQVLLINECNFSQEFVIQTRRCCWGVLFSDLLLPSCFVFFFLLNLCVHWDSGGFFVCVRRRYTPHFWRLRVAVNLRKFSNGPNPALPRAPQIPADVAARLASIDNRKKVHRNSIVSLGSEGAARSRRHESFA